MDTLIEVKNLTLKFKTDEGLITAVEDVSFSLNRGEVMGLVGESGSGKSVTAKSLMNLNAMNAVYSPESSITLHSAQEEIDVLSLKKPADLKVVRGGAISMIFQEPMTSFSPVHTIGNQLMEMIRLHKDVSKSEAKQRAVELLEMYGQTVHGDWLRFLDEEILNVLPKAEYELLAILANSKRPIPWPELAQMSNFNGKPPEQLISHGLLIELNDGFWLHEALKERLLREVGSIQNERKKKLESID